MVLQEIRPGKQPREEHVAFSTELRALFQLGPFKPPGTLGNIGSYFWWSHLKGAVAPLMTQTVKSLPAIRETWVQSLGWEDPLEEVMVTHSSILA